MRWVYSPRRVGLLIFLLAATLRLVVAYGTHAFQSPTRDEPVCIAKSINRTGDFADAFCASTGPTAHLAPAYPYFVALMMHFFPGDLQFTAAKTLVGIFSASLLWSLLPMFADRLGLGIATGVAGALLGALNVLRHYVELEGEWEAVAAAIALLFLCLLTFRLDLSKRARSAALWGGAWGLALLLTPSFLSVFLTLLLFLTATSRCSVRNAVLALVCLIAVITPWIVRDYKELGGFALIRDDLGLELSESNQPGAKPDSHDNEWVNPQSKHPSLNKAEQEKVRRLGELEYNHQRLRMARAWILSNPAEFLHLSVQRFYYYWVVQRAIKALTFVEFAETIVAWIGLWLIVREREKPWFFFLICVAVFPVIYYVVEAEERYRYPIEWILLICVGYALTALLGSMGVQLPHSRATHANGAFGKLVSGTGSSPAAKAPNTGNLVRKT